MSVVRTYCGHGIGDLFHCAPNVPHYAKNKAKGTMKVGEVFTIGGAGGLRMLVRGWQAAEHTAGNPLPTVVEVFTMDEVERWCGGQDAGLDGAVG